MKKFIEFLYPPEAKVDKKEYERRVGLCSGCDMRVKKTNSCGTLAVGSWGRNKKTGDKVKSCGCIVDAKAVLKSERCELGRW